MDSPSFEDFFENAVVPMHWVDGEGIILRANKAELDLLGFSREEYVGRHIADFHADGAKIEEILSRLSRKEALYKVPATIRTKNGAIKHVLISSNVHSRDGKFVNTRCVTLDVTAETELRKAEERLLLATHTGKLGLWEWDIATNRVTWTDSLYAIHGVEKTTSPITAEQFSALVHPDDRTFVSEAITRTLNEGAPYELEFRATHPDRGVISLFTNATLVKEGERPVRLVGATMDVTDRKQADKKFRLAVEAAPAGMVLVDDEGRILFVNEHAERLFGYGRSELTGRNIETLVPERFHEAHPGYRRQYGDQPASRPMGAGLDLYALRKDGTEIPVEVGLSAIPTDEGLMVLAAVVDISERKRADAQRELLLEELSHRVRNTLAVVQGIVRQTLKRASTSEEMQIAIEGRLSALATAHNLLTKTSWAAVPLKELVSDALQIDEESEKRISFDGPHIPLSPKQALGVALALHELYTNAIKYGALSSETGSVSFKWRKVSGPPPELELEWRERGGPAVSPPSHRGFGSLMIERALAQDLEGTVTMDFRKEGLVCTIKASVPDLGE